MNWKRKRMNPKNEQLNVIFFNKSLEEQMKCLNIDENITKEPRFKNMGLNDIIKQLWIGKYNSQKRKLINVN